MWFHVLFNTLHAPVFGIIAICLYRVARIVTRWSIGKCIAAVLALSVCLGALSELAQVPTGRDASLGDLLTDVLGASAFLFLAVASGFLDRPTKSTRIGLAIVGAITLIVVSLPLLTVSAAYIERNLQLPVLATPDASLGKHFWRRQHASVLQTVFPPTDQSAFRIQLQDGAWPGLIFHDTWSDWRNYSALVVEMGNDERLPLNLHLRVHDREHSRHDQPYSDRFNRTITLPQGPLLIRIPLSEIRDAPASRQLDLGQIDGMAVFSDASNAGRHFFLISIRLE